MFWRRVLEVLEQVHRAAPRSHLGPLVTAGLVLAPVGAMVSGRLGRSRAAVALGALAGSALAVAVSLTLFRGGGRAGSLARLRSCALTDPTVLSADGLANLALFVPAALLAVLAIGRPAAVGAAVAVVSVAIEGLQAVRAVGVCDSSDLLLNVLGGFGAAGVAALARRPFARCGPRAEDSVPGSDPCRRSC